MQKRITKLRAVNDNGSTLTIIVNSTEKTPKKRKFCFTNLSKEATRKHAKVVNDVLVSVFSFAGFNVQSVKVTK